MSDPAADKSVVALRQALGLHDDEPDIEPGAEIDHFPMIHRLVPVPTRKPAAVLDFDSLKSAGPTVPPPMQKGGRYDDLLQLLPIGESRALPIAEKKSLRNAVKSFRRRAEGNLKLRRFVMRTLSATQVGIWRLPDASKE